MATLKTSVWNVRFTLPKGDPKGRAQWKTDMTITCVCADIDTAIALVRGEHPAGVIWGVTHKGTDFTLFDPSVAVPSGSEDR